MLCSYPMSVFVSQPGLAVTVGLRLVLNSTFSHICLLKAYATSLNINNVLMNKTLPSLAFGLVVKLLIIELYCMFFV